LLVKECKIFRFVLMMKCKIFRFVLIRFVNMVENVCCDCWYFRCAKKTVCSKKRGTEL
jgi:hypothetical protein